MPVAVHWAYNDKWHIGIGGSYSRLLNSKEDFVGDQPVYFDPQLYFFRKEDIGAFINVGYQFGKNLFINLRIQRSVSSIRDYENIPAGFGYGSPGQYNNFFSLRIGYLIK